MKKLLNTLYILSEDTYLSYKNSNIQIYSADGSVRLFPLIGIEQIISFSYKGASPRLLGECHSRNIAVTFCTPEGRFLSHPVGKVNGSVLLRREQYRVADDNAKSLLIARNMIYGKIMNQSNYIQHCIGNHSDNMLTKEDVNQLREKALNCLNAGDKDSLRGIEGAAAELYFKDMSKLIRNKSFKFVSRNKRPPRDEINAMLSFGYTLLISDCSSALESIGLDSYVGMMHTDRSGRASLACDLAEEMRCLAVDRMVISMINLGQVTIKDFSHEPTGAVLLNDNGRKKFITEWQKRKKEEILHPFLEDKMMRGLIPYTQAMLLAKTIRNELSEYPVFLWR